MADSTSEDSSTEESEDSLLENSVLDSLLENSVLDSEESVEISVLESTPQEVREIHSQKGQKAELHVHCDVHCHVQDEKAASWVRLYLPDLELNC